MAEETGTDLADVSKGKGKASKSGPLGVQSGVEHLVSPRPGGVPKGIGQPPGAAREQSAPRQYSDLTDAQKVVCLERALAGEREQHQHDRDELDARLKAVQKQMEVLSSKQAVNTSLDTSSADPSGVPVGDATLARILAAALPMLATITTATKKDKEPIYSSANFVDPVELERNDIIPAIVDRTIERKQFCPLSACTAEVSMRYALDSSAIPSIKKLLDQDDKATEVVDADRLTPNDLAIDKTAWEQGYQRLLRVMAKYADAETLASLTYLRDYFKAHQLFDLDFPIIARCDLTCRKKFFSSPVDFRLFNLEKAIDTAKDQQTKYDNIKLIHSLQSQHSQLRTSQTPSYIGNRYSPMASDSRRGSPSPYRSQVADLGYGAPLHSSRGSGRGGPFRSDSAQGPSCRCFCCGAKDHRANACKASSREGGGSLYSSWSGRRVARLSDGLFFCYDFSGARTCHRAAACTDLHECSICGSRSHGNSVFTC